MYLDTLTELAPWFFALDHTNYAYWIPVHLKDMTKLPNFQIRRQPNVAKEFHDGNFVIRKTGRVFSSITIDQAHKQNNAPIKGDGGAIGLTNNPSALQRWMVAGLQVSRTVEEFHKELDHCVCMIDHHDQSPTVQKNLARMCSS